MFPERIFIPGNLPPLSRAEKRRIKSQYFESGSDAGKVRLAKTCVRLARKGYSVDDFLYEDGLEEVFREQLQESLEHYQSVKKGFIYLATNPVYSAGLYKIGATRKAPEDRRNSLRSAGTPGEFLFVKAWEVPDAFGAETQCRKLLKSRWVNREFYSGSYTELTLLLDEIAETEHEIIRRLGLLWPVAGVVNSTTIT